MERNRIDWFEIYLVVVMTILTLIGLALMYIEGTELIMILERQNEVAVVSTTVEPRVIEPEPEQVIEEPTVLYFDVPLSEDLQDHIFAECETRGIDPAMIIAMIERESRFDVDAIGDSGRSYGLMQIQPKWHGARMEKLGCDDLLDPYQNVTVGIDLLEELIARGKGVEWALMAYNGGPSYANRLSEKSIVSDYAASVMASSRAMDI